MKKIIPLILIIISMQVYAQRRGNKFWNLRYIKGSVTFAGDYFYQFLQNPNSPKQELNSQLYRGILEANSESFIIHPNFLTIDLELSYRPGTRKDEYILIPNRSENTNAEKFSAEFFLFKKRPYNGSFYFDFNHSFTNRDFVTNSELFKSAFGFVANASNKFLPVRLKYDYDNWTQKELQLDKEFKNISNSLNLNTSKLLFGSVMNRLNLNYSNFDRKYSDGNTRDISDNLEANLTSIGEFEEPLKIGWNSTLSYLKRSGFDASNRFQMLEKIFFYLPQNFTVTTGLQFLNSAYVGLKDDRITLDMAVKHKLYESLVSNAYVSFTESNQSIVIEKTNDAGFSFDYSKKIPTGTLNLNYSFDRESKSDKGQLTVNSIRDERHKLEDGVIVLLNNPNVDANSIIVKSPDGLIQYRLNLDYEIYVHDSFYEIRRTLGGQIANGDVVLVDYTTLTDPSFDYTSMNNSYSISLNLFENFLNLSYSGNNLSFGDYSGINNIALRTVNRNVYSGRINLFGATLGFEYDNFESNIVPYQSKRYYAEYGYWEERKILVSIATNYRDYYLVEEKLKQKFFDLVTKLSYSLGFYSKVNLEFTYRVQKGTGIDLNFATGKIELYTLYRAIDIILGGELFNQNYIGQINNYYRTYLKLRRSF